MAVQLTKLELQVLAALLAESQTSMDIYLTVKSDQQELTLETVELTLQALVDSGRMYVLWASCGGCTLSTNRMKSKRYSVVGAEKLSTFYHLVDREKTKQAVRAAKDMQADIDKLEIEVEMLQLQLAANLQKLRLDSAGLEAMWKRRINKMHSYNETRDIGVYSYKQQWTNSSAKHYWQIGRHGANDCWCLVPPLRVGIGRLASIQS